VRVQSVALENHGQVAVPRRGVRDVLPVEQEAARAGWDQAGDHSEQRRLATPTRAEQYQEFPGVDLKGDAVNGRDPGESFCQALDLNPGHRWLLLYPHDDCLSAQLPATRPSAGMKSSMTQ
jgi:hypothetical protein